ncbi:Tm-1-like ATP-binding domain-containing protein [Microbacterium sp. CIAB417]|uniref:Tm-1-like ATP-binding domain-containing protein n=1 Tax=Microbacterium sp. CIAB417 TaxID=2860287 RepID=UPI001FACAFDA|nr:Tm-1-like ATP-binding domain-containing protein [Microbacterium sp. CIAB417]
MTAPAVHLVGALDTKGVEYGFLRDRLRAAGLPVILVDTGVLDRPQLEAEVDRTAVADAGGELLGDLQDRPDRNHAMQVMAAGAARIVSDRHARGLVSAVLAIGGSNAGFVMSRVAGALPIGVPKLLVSTIVAGDTRPYVGTSDLMMMYPVVDIAGLNSVSIPVLARAADALIGILQAVPVPPRDGRIPVIGATMFGVTTGCVNAVQEKLEADGAEVQVFHATGTGGRSFEALIRAGAFDAVADLTTTELADELLGGVCSAGPDRLTAAALVGIPQIVSPGAMDMANFGARGTVPAWFADRLLLEHNPSVTLMRTSAEENAVLGRTMAERLNAAAGPVEVHIPALGFSQIAVEGAPFHDPVADAAFIDGLRGALSPTIPVVIHDLDINAPAFAAAVHSALQGIRTPHKKG